MHCYTCMAQKGPSWQSWAPLRPYLVGSSMEHVEVHVLGPFPSTEPRNCYILMAMDYFTKGAEAYTVPDQSTTTIATKLLGGPRGAVK